MHVVSLQFAKQYNSNMQQYKQNICPYCTIVKTRSVCAIVIEFALVLLHMPSVTQSRRFYPLRVLWRRAKPEVFQSGYMSSLTNWMSQWHKLWLILDIKKGLSLLHLLLTIKECLIWWCSHGRKKQTLKLVPLAILWAAGLRQWLLDPMWDRNRQGGVSGMAVSNVVADRTKTQICV